jgi:hypothetical protein
VADDSTDVATVTVVPNESEAMLACGLLRANGIECFYRALGVGPGFGANVGPCEILVQESDVARAKELLGEPS